ncbi:maltose ABC transporter permease MalF [Roseateles sp. SL47]|uniref:maltose ABC transporter permease MalF n=1 Tax=Roseateles sp. SL47 TaxID=2995138 RepID=UPI002270E91E|nr:maltose ABC transporter permease MalF [Roseateles sp. SL47]WAC75412.1 maltose ABC transporter permease MalF [Roseateles sp. SL47]
MNATTASTSPLAASLASPLAESPLARAYSVQPPGLMQRLGRGLYWPVVAAIAMAALYLVYTLYAGGQTWWALGTLALFGAGFGIYLNQSGFAWRYLFPGVTGMLVFIAFPLLYTTQIGFTNYSSAHLLSQERVRDYLLDQHEAVPDQVRDYSLHADGRQFRLVLRHPDTGTVEWVTPPLALRRSDQPVDIPLQAATDAAASDHSPWGPALSLRDLVQHREALAQLRLHRPGGAADAEVLRYLGLREFGPIRRHFEEQPDGSLLRRVDGQRFQPNARTGYYENAAGDPLQPGYKVMVGWKNYARMVLDADFRGPFLSIFTWTVLFSLLTVLFATAIGMMLAVLLNWEDLRFRGTYRTLLFLPYAVPGFISILVFKGLFNQNFGEINAMLDALFGVKPAWFADPLLAKTMLLIVNVWLGYPYIMILTAGLLKAIPADLYEASAIAGAGPLTNFFKITVPLIIKPLSPLLVAAFAFNFNNFVVIALLTDGRPDYLSSKIPAGQTDILVSYTYRIAFRDSGSDFGLAAAISTLIFFLVAALSVLNLRLMRKP